MKPICITFAGPYGASKSPIAQYLSCQLGWPRLENDVIRKEVREDQLSPALDTEEYNRRAVARIKELVQARQNFIYDASQDRGWQTFMHNFEPDAYQFGVISIDLSPSFYKKLIQAKEYPLTDQETERYLAEHQQFLDRFSDAIICHITDENFLHRLNVAWQAVRQFIDDKTIEAR